MNSAPPFTRHSDVLRAIRPYCGNATLAFIELALAQARAPITIEAYANQLGIHRRALEHRFAAARLPPPNPLVAWCRLLHAAALLESGEVRLDAIASTCGFVSAGALRKAASRCGLSIRALRAPGGFGVAVVSFTTMFRHSTPERTE